MQSGVKILFGMATLLSLLLPYTVRAGVSITVDIGGTALSGTDTVNLSGDAGEAMSYGAITIQGIGGQPAKVTAGDDTTQDRLLLLNAKITPTTGTQLPFPTEYAIRMEGIFTDPPTATTANGKTLYYRVAGNGSFTRGGLGTPYPTVRARGNIGTSLNSSNVPQLWTQITNVDLSKTCVVISCGTFFSSPNMLNQQFPSPDITGARVLKGEFWIKFTRSGDSLTLSSANGLVVDHTAPGGPGDEEPDAFWVPQKQYMEKRCKEKYCEGR